MRPSRHPVRLVVPLAAAALAAPLLLAGCDEQPQERRTDGGQITRDIDARAYAEDYRSSSEGDSTAVGTAPAPKSAALSGAGPADGHRIIPVPQPPGPLDDDTFVDAGTSGFVDAARDARSTFALDVDTGSWNVAQTLLRDGYRPPAASIRPEEWVNAVPADLPEPDGALGISAETASAPTLDDGTQLVRVGVQARSASADDRPPVNLTMVVDRSGSMDIRDRLGLVQSSLALLADGLRDDDTVSVVSFEDHARPILEPTPVRDTDAILAAIEELRPGGSTNLEAGLRLGYEQARAAYDEDATNLVLLASDGVANVGETGPGSLVDEIASEGADGIHLVTVGYGMGNYNDHLMEQLADLGDGFYAYVDDYAEAERLFRDRLATALVPVADEARVQVELDPEVVSSYRLVGYDNRGMADDDFADQAVDAGELGAGHHATALYEVRLAEGVEPGTTIGRATVQWTSVEHGDTERATADVVAGDGAPPAGAFALQAVVADLAQLLRSAPPIAGRGVTLSALEERASALAAAGVPGATEVLSTVRRAMDARPGVVVPPGPIR